MTDKLFDDFVKDKLGQHNSGAPMHVWERIREKEKDNKKGFFFFKRFWLTGIVLLTLSGMVYLSWDSVIKHSNQEKLLTTTTEQNNTNNSNQTSTIAQTENDQNKAGLSATNNNTVLEKQDNENTLLTQGPVQQTEAGKNEPVGINNTSHSDVAAPLKIKKQSNALIKENNAEINSQQKIQADKTGNLIHSPVQSSEQTAAKEFVLSFTNMAAYRNSLKDFRIGNVPQRTVGPSCPTVNGPRRNDLYIEVYGSPDYTMRSFSNSANLNNYIAQRRTSEDNRNGFSAGVRIAKNIGEKTLLKAGVNYSQINERLKIVNENEKQITQIITIRTVIRTPGDTLFIRDTTYFEQTGTRYRTTYNRYRFIDIPVIFSYEFGNPEILAFSVNAGPVFNVVSFYRGEVLDTTFNPVKISTAKGSGPNNWRSNIGISVFASFAVYKRVNERLQIFAEPYFRYNFKPVTQSTNFVNQRYTTTGMQLGIRYNLFNEKQRYR